MSIWTRFLGGSSKVEHRTLVPVVDGSNPSLPTVSRRSFLIGTAATAVAVPSIARTFFGPPQGGWPVSDFTTAGMRYKSYERYSEGWINPKGLYECGPCQLKAARFREIVEPGLNRVFSETYANSCQEYEAIFGDGVALNSTAHPGSDLITDFNTEDEQHYSLNESSLERLMIEIKDLENLGHKIRLDPNKPWLIQPGRRWFK